MRSSFSALAVLITAFSAVFGVNSVYASDFGTPISCVGGSFCNYVASDGKIRDAYNGNEIFASSSAKTLVGKFFSSQSSAPFVFESYLDFPVSYDSIEFIKQSYDKSWYVLYRNGRLSFYQGDVETFFITRSDVKDADVSWDGNTPDTFVAVFDDGTSNVASGNDNVRIISMNHWDGLTRWMALKSDGTVETNMPYDFSSMRFKEISPGKNLPDCVNFLGVLENGNLIHPVWCGGDVGFYPVPAGIYDSPSVSYYDFACARRVSDSRPVCFNSSGNVYNESATIPPSSISLPSGVGSSNSSEYCIESPTSSGSYVFSPLATSGPITADSSFFGGWESFSTSAIDYKFYHVEFEHTTYLSGALLNTNVSEGFTFVSSSMAPVFEASIEIVSKTGSVNYLRVFGDSHGYSVEYSAILEDSDGNRSYKLAYTRSDMGRYLMYEGAEKLVGWRLRFPKFDSDITIKRFEIGHREYVSTSGTRTTCYTKEEHEQLVKNPSYDPTATGSLGSIAVGMSYYVGELNGGTWTGTTGELYERVFSGSTDYENMNPPENYTKVVSSYFTKCEAPKADLGGFSFLSWGFEGTIPVVNYSYDFRPFTGVECPLRVVVANYENLKGLLYNR